MYVFPAGGSGICYYTSGKEIPANSGNYKWEVTSDPVTLSAAAYCSPLTTDACITLDHGCGMKLDTIACNQNCAALCEINP